MSNAKVVLEPAFQGVGHKPYPLLRCLEIGCWFILSILSFQSRLLCSLYVVIPLNLNTEGQKYGGLKILSQFLCQNQIMVNSTVEIRI